MFQGGHALLIGVGGSLPETIRDAKALHNLFVDPARASYPEGQVALLTESGAHRQAILDGLDRLAKQAAKTADAVVFVYFSGHGVRVERAHAEPEYFLVPHGHDPTNRTGTAVSGAEFTAGIEALRTAGVGKLIVLLDCCHAGGIPATKDETEERLVKSPEPPELARSLELGKGRGAVVLASSRAEEKSLGASDQNKGYSTFTECLLEALTGKAAGLPDGFARVLEVISYVMGEVPRRTIDLQHPYLLSATGLTENFALCYYAGGEKGIPGRTKGGVAAPPPYKVKLLKQEMAGLVGAMDLLAQKLARLRTRLAIETSEAYKFQLENQIKEAMNEQSLLMAQADAIYAQLSAAGQ